jgi:hypothetical protein
MRTSSIPFRAVLRGLRWDAGLTILAAAKGHRLRAVREATVGPAQGRVANSSGTSPRTSPITDYLHLLLFARVLDRRTPKAGGPLVAWSDEVWLQVGGVWIVPDDVRGSAPPRPQRHA